MSAPILLTKVRLVAASPGRVSAGLIGWVTCVVDGALRLDGVMLRRTAAGRLTLSFPGRRDLAGKRHAYVRPVDDRTRREVERQVFAALGLTEEAP